MVTHSVNVRHKGQMTLPADVREELGVRDGGRILLERRDNSWVLVRPDEQVENLAGSLREYAGDTPLEWDREEIWTEIATERDDRIRRQLKEEDGE